MPKSEHQFDVEAETTNFVEELAGTLTAVLGEDVRPFDLDVREHEGQVRVAARTPDIGIPLTVEGREILRLTIVYRFTHDSRKAYLKTEKSSISVYPVDTATPLFRYDYLHDAGERIPAAHFNVHAHRDEALFALYVSSRERAKRRQRNAEDGIAAKLADVHFPVGGHRFRPCVEDVLEMLIVEFGVDKQPAWKAAINKGREAWRRKQLKAAVWDDPGAAREALEEFLRSGRPEQINEERLHAL